MYGSTEDRRERNRKNSLWEPDLGCSSRYFIRSKEEQKLWQQRGHPWEGEGKGKGRRQEVLSIPAALSYIPDVFFAPWSTADLPKPPSAPHEVLLCIPEAGETSSGAKSFWVRSKQPCCPPSSQLMPRENYLLPSLAASSKILHVLVSESRKGCSIWLLW